MGSGVKKGATDECNGGAGSAGRTTAGRNHPNAEQTGGQSGSEAESAVTKECGQCVVGGGDRFERAGAAAEEAAAGAADANDAKENDATANASDDAEDHVGAEDENDQVAAADDEGRREKTRRESGE